MQGPARRCQLDVKESLWSWKRVDDEVGSEVEEGRSQRTRTPRIAEEARERWWPLAGDQQEQCQRADSVVREA